MKTTEEMIEVMQAFVRGEPIETNYNDKWGWVLSEHPKWDWSTLDYRIKPKTKFVPFESAEEFLESQKKHGIILINSDDAGFESSINCYEHVVLVSIVSNLATDECFETIFKNFTFQDGTPCGKEI